MIQFVRILIICSLFGSLILQGCHDSGNEGPAVTITNPPGGSEYSSGASVPFSGAATDAEGGNVLGSTFVWKSSLDGEIWKGSKEFERHDLSVGSHVITLTVTDSNGRSANTSITITIKYNHPPTATIISPVNGNIFAWDSKIVFSGTGYDIEDGKVLDDRRFQWFIDGWWAWELAPDEDEGKSFSTYRLYDPGKHTITLTVTDKNGQKGSDTIEITLLPPDYPRITFTKLPDTGQTDSYTNAFGEDSDYSINPRSYTKLDNNGNPLADNAAAWVMVRDNVTGLIWEAKTDDGSIHDKDNRYTWDDVQDTYIPSLNNSKFGEFLDWRMPTVLELSTLIDHDSCNPAIDSNYFPNTQPYYYLSMNRTMQLVYPVFVNFESGRIGGSPCSFDETYFNPCPGYMRAVRGGNSPASSQGFADNHDGTITESKTGLMWMKGTESGLTWEEAITYCETLTLAGYSDWRLPNRIELQSLVDYNHNFPSPFIDVSYFPDTKIDCYWSSTSDEKSDGAWVANFGSPRVEVAEKTEPHFVRPVRGGQ